MGFLGSLGWWGLFLLAAVFAALFLARELCRFRLMLKPYAQYAPYAGPLCLFLLVAVLACMSLLAGLVSALFSLVILATAALVVLAVHLIRSERPGHPERTARMELKEDVRAALFERIMDDSETNEMLRRSGVTPAFFADLVARLQSAGCLRVEKLAQSETLERVLAIHTRQGYPDTSKFMETMLLLEERERRRGVQGRGASCGQCHEMLVTRCPSARKWEP